MVHFKNKGQYDHSRIVDHCYPTICDLDGLIYENRKRLISWQKTSAHTRALELPLRNPLLPSLAPRGDTGSCLWSCHLSGSVERFPTLARTFSALGTCRSKQIHWFKLNLLSLSFVSHQSQAAHLSPSAKRFGYSGVWCLTTPYLCRTQRGPPPRSWCQCGPSLLSFSWPATLPT